MVARTIPAETPITLTRENHPENAVEAEEKPTTVTLASTVFIGALCSLVGMTIGSAALSTAFQTSTFWEVVSMIPLVAATVALIGGWMGAFFHMVRTDMSKKDR
jgi:hypothetical protein